MRGRYVEQVWHTSATRDAYVPPRHRRPCRYQAFVPDPVEGFELGLPAELASVVIDAEALVRELNAGAGRVLRPLARLLLRTEAIASSKVEGLQVDVADLARAEARSEAGGRLGPQAAEIVANIDAMSLAVEEAGEAPRLEVTHLLDIHRRLLVDAPRGAGPGAFRGVQNWIGGNDYNPCGADYVPPPPEHVGALVADLLSYCGDDTVPALVQAAVAHAQFELIHPFVDGNGRSGRALAHVLLRRRGVATEYVPPISVVFAGAKGRYVDGLRAYAAGDVTGWVEHFSVAVARSAEFARRYLDHVTALQAEWRQRLADASAPRADAAAWKIIDVLPAHPVITAAVAVAATARTKPAVGNAIAQLVDAGVLVPLSSSRRRRVYEADGFLDLVAYMEATHETSM